VGAQLSSPPRPCSAWSCTLTAHRARPHRRRRSTRRHLPCALSLLPPRVRVRGGAALLFPVRSSAVRIVLPGVGKEIGAVGAYSPTPAAPPRRFIPAGARAGWYCVNRPRMSPASALVAGASRGRPAAEWNGKEISAVGVSTDTLCNPTLRLPLPYFCVAHTLALPPRPCPAWSCRLTVHLARRRRRTRQHLRVQLISSPRVHLRGGAALLPLRPSAARIVLPGIGRKVT
jgi:hypothetical protein